MFADRESQTKLMEFIKEGGGGDVLKFSEVTESLGIDTGEWNVAQFMFCQALFYAARVGLMHPILPPVGNIDDVIDGAYKRGYEDGDKNSSEAKYYDGYQKGYDDGAKNPSTVQYSQGYVDGHDSAVTGAENKSKKLTSEYFQGYKNGVKDGADHAKTQFAPIDAALTTEFNRGFSEGVEKGTKLGFEDGRRWSSKTKYFEGHHKGYQVGFDEGKICAKNETADELRELLRSLEGRSNKAT